VATGFLLDVHIPLAVAAALRRLVPEAEIQHVARWHAGALRTAEDEPILLAAAEANLILVTHDIRTVHPLANRWVAEGRTFPGVVFVRATGASARDIGGVAAALADLYGHLELLDPAYPVVYLQPSR
jgi:predicted nuclease of predicted toxin-antitoxin system